MASDKDHNISETGDACIVGNTQSEFRYKSIDLCTYVLYKNTTVPHSPCLSAMFIYCSMLDIQLLRY